MNIQKCSLLGLLAFSFLVPQLPAADEPSPRDKTAAKRTLATFTLDESYPEALVSREFLAICRRTWRR